MATVIPDGHLAHYGIGGMKWGIRRYQNADGSLTAEGKRRYGSSTRGRAKMYTQALRSETNKQRTFMENEQTFFDQQSKHIAKKDALNASKTDQNAEKVDRRIKKLEKKIVKDKEGIAANAALRGNAQRIIDHLLEDAMANNYKITSKEVTRGKNLINKMFGIEPTTVTEYKVKKTRYSA